MGTNTPPEIRSLIAQVFGPEAVATIDYRPGLPPVGAAPKSEREEWGLKLQGLVRQTMGARAAAVFAVATIHRESMPGNDFDPANRYGTRRWSKAEVTFMKKPLPRSKPCR